MVNILDVVQLVNIILN